MSEIGFKTKFMSMQPTTSASVPNGSFYIDSANGNQASFKDNSGNTSVIGAIPSSNLFIKQMQASVVMPINTPVSKLANGKIVPADSDAANGQEYVGITTVAALAVDAIVSVLLPGANVVGALTGLGFLPGQEIFLGENGGFVNDVSAFAGNNDSIIRVGIADCSAGAASAIVNDLIAFTEVVARP